MVWNKSEFFLEATYPTTKNAAFNVKNTKRGLVMCLEMQVKKNELIKKGKGYLQPITLHVDDPKVPTFQVRIDKYKPFICSTSSYQKKMEQYIN